MKTKMQVWFATLALLSAAGMGLAAPPPSEPSAAASSASSSLVLSDEAPGCLITRLIQAGYGNDSLYQTLLFLRNISDPSIPSLWEVITPVFLQKLQSCPADSAVFTQKLKTYTGKAIAISDDGTVQMVNISGSTYDGQPSVITLADLIIVCLSSNVRCTYSPQAFLTSWQSPGPDGSLTTYNTFAVIWSGPALPLNGSGDCDSDGRVDAPDAVVLNLYLTYGPPLLGCDQAADMNHDGVLNRSDLVALLALLAGN